MISKMFLYQGNSVLPKVAAPMSQILFYGGGGSPQEKSNRLMDFPLSTVCLEPSDPLSSYTDTLSK